MTLVELIAKLQTLPATASIYIEDICGCWGDIKDVYIVPEDEKDPDQLGQTIAVLRLDDDE